MISLQNEHNAIPKGEDFIRTQFQVIEAALENKKKKKNQENTVQADCQSSPPIQDYLVGCETN